MPDFNPSRLSLARRRRGLTKTRLASELNISSRMVTAYERGEYVPSDAVLEALSVVLNFRPEFFAGDDIDEPPVNGTSFRALSTLTARQRDEALGSGALALTLSDWIDERFTLPVPAVPRYEGVDPETAAAAVRSAWGLGERPIRSVVHLLEAHGVRVFSLPEECASVDAFSFWRGDRPYVFLNTRKSAEHSRMDGAHELGHLVLHWRGAARGRDAEHEAAQFGSAFLMSRGSVLAGAPPSGTLSQIIDAKRTWGVSAAALAYRMRHINPPLLSDWQYRSLFIEMNRLGYLRAEPNGMKPETSQVLGKVFQQLREQGTSIFDVAKSLSIGVDDLNEIIFGLVLTSVPPTGAPEQQRSQSRPNLRLIE